MKFILFIFGFYSLSTGYAQITVEKDTRINNLIAKQSEILSPATSLEIDGYRLQVTFESSRSELDNARSRFVAQYPKIDTYVEYKAPYYFLKVGDFRTHLEAEKVKSEMSAQFPTCMIIKEKINLPRIDQ